MGQRPTLVVSAKSTMYSYASVCALTRVSVPSTGSANASTTMKACPTTLPCSMPITSMLPPDLACIAIFSSASADMWTLHRSHRTRLVIVSSSKQQQVRYT